MLAKTLGIVCSLDVSPARLVEIEPKGAVPKVSRHIAKIMSKLEDEMRSCSAGPPISCGSICVR